MLLPSITLLVNASLAEGCFPKEFKEAVVSPIIKKSTLSCSDLKNYRPVSGLCFLSKLVERVASAQLINHINSNGLDNPLQSAYKAGHSTETALLSIKNDIHLSLSRGESTALVLLDLSAAFDTIDHSTLIDCLKSWFGVCGSALEWFVSYLCDRYQAVKIGSTLSDFHKLIFGVPQGSVLGPLLFSLYTTPLTKIISKYKDVKYHFYADDTQLFVKISPKNATSALAQLNACLNDVRDWMSTSKLKLNPEKTEFIVFGSHSQRRNLEAFFPVNILGNFLKPSDAVRNLGVIFDADFSFSAQVRNICKGCFLQLRDFRRIRRFLTEECAILVANALVSSRLDYCNSLFRSLSTFNMKKLQCIQNTLARIVTNRTKFTSITPILKDLHWLPVKYRSIFKTATLVYKYLHTGNPSYFGSSIKLRDSKYNTRHGHPNSMLLVVPQFVPSVYKSSKQYGLSFSFDAPQIWNDLPAEVRLASSLPSFRKKLKSYLFAKAFPP